MSKALALYSSIFLFVFCISLYLGGKTEVVSYDQLRADFKSQLCQRQQGILEQDQYLAFLEPYIEKAEKTLQIPQYLMKNSKSKQASVYFEALLNYHVAYFHSYAKTYPNSKKDLVQYEQDLENSIELIKEDGKLVDIDVKQELKNTTELFAQANRRLYRKLGIVFRLCNFFRTLGS